MKRALPIIAVLLAVVGTSAAVWSRRMSSSSNAQTVVVTPTILKHLEWKEQEASGLCPWRNKLADMQRFFPGSDSAIETKLVVSSQRIAISKRLGRVPTGDENALRAYRIMRGRTPCGTVIARRVRGTYGLIELVLAIDAGSSAIKYARIQRLREPQAAANALQSEAWLEQFRGMTGDSNWQPVANSPLIPTDARASANAITDAARTALILHSTAQSIRVAVPQP